MEIRNNLIKYLEYKNIDYVLQTEKIEKRFKTLTKISEREWETNWWVEIIKLTDKKEYFKLENTDFFNIEFKSFTLLINEFIFDFVKHKSTIKGVLELNGNFIQNIKLEIKNLDFLKIKELV